MAYKKKKKKTENDETNTKHFRKASVIAELSPSFILNESKGKNKLGKGKCNNGDKF